jgi:hypothetical protein
VAAAARAAGLDVLDLTPAFAGEDGKRWWARPWDAHPNEEGHAVAAQEIGRAIEERGMIPTNGPNVHPLASTR